MNNLRYILNNKSIISSSINLTSNLIQRRTFKSDLKIKWIRPEKIPCIKPEKSGDLSGLPQIDKTQPQLKFRESKELATADELVKRLFSLEFAPGARTLQVQLNLLKNQVKRHEYDVGSIEVKIARWTGVIRAFQEITDRFPRNKNLKVILKELIDRRKKHLKYLRRWDYKKFEWVLENLDLVYKPPPNEFHWITRKESLVKLTNKYCDDLRHKRLEAYRTQLETEQIAFLEEKINVLEFMRKEQQDCGAEVTITSAEILDVKNKLNELQEKKVTKIQ